ncbi:hypothetical protein FHW12_003139 [Dokdonella fugitiva]|uniref:Uncharacterized protein n=1 Tax=Dokdonella fugitiva TaxID=328517 RepID=A0A839F1P6_9GAMM|nr:hypothetical protein [Dokdonella fugitiva]MBA8888903.1 hypothetical protein [Dokdonella fugitiva]
MFLYAIGQSVTRSDSSQASGKVIGRAEYNYCDNRYQVVRMDDRGNTIQEWWDEGDIQTPPANRRGP